MQFVLHLCKKVPIDEYTQEMIEELENRLEAIDYVFSAQFDDKSLQVSIRYIHPDEDRKDDFSIDDVDKSMFQSAIKFSKYFRYVGISG